MLIMIYLSRILEFCVNCAFLYAYYDINTAVIFAVSVCYFKSLQYSLIHAILYNVNYDLRHGQFCMPSKLRLDPAVYRIGTFWKSWDAIPTRTDRYKFNRILNLHTHGVNCAFYNKWVFDSTLRRIADGGIDHFLQCIYCRGKYSYRIAERSQM